MLSNELIMRIISVIATLLGLLIFYFIVLRRVRKRFDKQKHVSMCPNCGSLSKHMAGMGFGGLYAGAYKPAKYKCDSCSYEGIFPEVDKEKINEFIDELKKNKEKA